MRIPFLLLLFLANIVTYSQNYCPVSNTQDMHIAVESSFPSLPISSIVTIQNDSIYASPDYTVYFNKPILRYNNMPFSLEICKLSNLLGNTIIYDNNNYYRIISKNGPSVSIEDTFHLYNNKAIGESWIFNKTVDAHNWMATVTERTTEVILGTLDSVIYFSITLEDNLGNSLTHEMNGGIYKLSKSFGFYQFYDFFTFPNYSTPLLLVGLSNPDAGDFIPYVADIFDFEIGDIFHYTYEFETDFTSESSKYQYELIDKSISADTLFLVWNYDSEGYEGYYGFYDSVYLNDSIIYNTINLTNYLGFNDIPLVPFIYSNGALEISGFNSIITDPDFGFCRRVDNDYDFLFGDSCTNYYGMGIRSHAVYGKGIGLRSSYAINQYHDEAFTTLVYYKKGEVEWGTPLEINTAITEINNSDLTLLKNPVMNDEGINISSSNYLKSSGSIYDLTGRLVYKVDNLVLLSGKNVINLPYIKAGIYLIQIQSEAGENLLSEKIMIVNSD